MKLFYSFIRTLTGFAGIPICILLAWEKIDNVLILQSLKHELFYLLSLGIIFGLILAFSIKGLARIAVYSWRKWKAGHEKKNQAREAEQTVQRLRAI